MPVATKLGTVQQYGLTVDVYDSFLKVSGGIYHGYVVSIKDGLLVDGWGRPFPADTETGRDHSAMLASLATVIRENRKRAP